MNIPVAHFLKSLCIAVLLAFISFNSSVHAALEATGVNSTTPTNATIVGAVDGTDLGNAASVTGAAGFFGTAADLNDGVINPGTGADSLYLPKSFGTGNKLPQTYTFALDVGTNPQGYDITSIESFAGWTINGPQLGNQKYTLSISTVSAPTTFVSLGTFEYIPFANNTATGGSITQMTVSDDGAGLIGTGVHSVRIEFINHDWSGANTAVDGSVYYEVDINGQATGSTPADVTITSPTTRKIIQRDTENVADIDIQGTYLTTPDSIEARVVVMSGSNSGTTSAWKTIDASPNAGTFSGTLTNIIAGGWYQLEVRPVVSGVAGDSAVIQKVGIGDIYVTAGQSNSANHGTPALTPTSDRVVTLSAYGGASWRHGYDPQPLATGTGGSVWSRLGDLLVSTENVPVGFVVVGVGGSPLSSWQPGQGNYTSRLKAAVQSFPANGFRACLWHQGETDAVNNVTATAHAALLATMIAESRTDAGWTIPWYIAEASFIPSITLTQEEPVTAGQRLATMSDANVHLGPSTNEFTLENGGGLKLHDTVHFSAIGLMDHAVQWRDILLGRTTLGLENGDFEANTTASITTTAPLADGDVHIVDLSSNASPGVLNWRILSAAGTTAADGSYGYYNPDASFYTNAVDTINAGVMENMKGKHVAFFSGGTAGNHFLQTTRSYLQPNKEYNFSVSLGIRDSGTFAGAKLELLANGQVLATGTFTKANLDTLAGGNATGKFTVANITYTSGATVAPNQLIACKISKVNAGGYVDVDAATLNPLDLGAIWFIGDSITQSNADGSGSSSPRKELYDLLVDENVDFTYTGHFTANIDGLPTTGGTAATNLYHYHSGISGSTIGVNSNGRTDMTTNIDSGQNFWTSGRLAVEKPKIILIMLGTNDTDLNDDVANAPARLSTLVDKIMSQPGVGTPAIFVAQIPPNLNPAENPRVLAYNTALPDIVRAQRVAGRDIYLVDQYTHINANTGGLMIDTLHTNTAGNVVLAEQWLGAIQQRFAPKDTTSLEAWQFDNFGGASVTGAGSDEDPDGDGQSNLHEFSYGSDPNSASSMSHPISFDGTTFTVTRRIGIPAGLSYNLEESLVLTAGNWTKVPSSSLTVDSISGEFETISITRATGSWMNSARDFLRLGVVEVR